jgi:hypothetical protein
MSRWGNLNDLPVPDPARLVHEHRSASINPVDAFWEVTLTRRRHVGHVLCPENAPVGESWEAFALDGFRIPPLNAVSGSCLLWRIIGGYFVHRTHDSSIQFISEINHSSSPSNGSGSRSMPDIRQMVLSDAIKLLT